MKSIHEKLSLGQVILVCMDPFEQDWIPAFYAGPVYAGEYRIDVPCGYGIDDRHDLALNAHPKLGFNYAMSVEDFESCYNSKKNLNHLDFVWGINPWEPSSRCMGFYDKEEESIIGRKPWDYMQFELIPRDQWPQWAVDAHNELQLELNKKAE